MVKRILSYREIIPKILAVQTITLTLGHPVYLFAPFFIKALSVRNYLANNLEVARRALLSFVKEQDHVIGRFESYRVFREQCVVEDEVYSGDFPLQNQNVGELAERQPTRTEDEDDDEAFSGYFPLQNVREGAASTLGYFSIQDRRCDLIADLR